MAQTLKWVSVNAKTKPKDGEVVVIWFDERKTTPHWARAFYETEKSQFCETEGDWYGDPYYHVTFWARIPAPLR